MITLLTDFGLSDAYVGIMKGVIFSIHPSAVVVDITHDIAPQDISGAAICISSAYRYFPAGSIHVVVVDPGVGTRRAIIALAMNGHLFLSPDNGVLSRIISSSRPDAVIRVEDEKYFLRPVSNTFHGRDIFAPVAAHLSRGVSIKQLGPEITVDHLELHDLPEPDLSGDGEVIGQIISVDRFGNLITNIDYRFLKDVFPTAAGRKLKIMLGAHQIFGLSDSYQEAGRGSLLAIIGSTGFMEIAVNGGSAAEFCGAGRKRTVTVSMLKSMSEKT